jgi:hypothetical protein
MKAKEILEKLSKNKEDLNFLVSNNPSQLPEHLMKITVEMVTERCNTPHFLDQKV